jgi:NADPH-dependent curcumin reductase
MSEARVNRQWRMKSRPVGMVSRENFEWAEAPVPALKDGEFLVRNLYLSFDPTQRAWMARDDVPARDRHRRGDARGGDGAGDRIEASGLQAGGVRQRGVRLAGLLRGDGKGMLGVQKVPPGVPLPMAMSVLGLTGLTAYFGMLRVGQPKAGETVVVSGAAGRRGRSRRRWRRSRARA